MALTVHHPRPSRRGGDPETLDLFSRTDPEEGFILRCHFCGSSHPAPRACPECHREGLATVGAGTQRVEQELGDVVPKARMLRLDYDSVGGREGFLRAWKEITEGDVDIIMGTQMIAKGLHLERVTLVGVVLADIGMFLPDFRADERTFTLLTQVAGRAGRISEGEVIFQTYMPHHQVIRFATQHDYEGFAEWELRRRKQLNFPPITKLTSITISDPDRERAFQTAKQAAYLLTRYTTTPGCRGTQVNGPNVAPIARLNARFRFRILVRAKTHKPIANLIRAASADGSWKIPSSTRVSLDVDPLDLM